MKTKYIIIIILLAVTVAIFVQQLKKPSSPSCVKPQPPLFQPTQTRFTDKEIIDAVFSDYKVPDGFFKDTLERGEKIWDSVYYEKVLKNNEWEFYCTNDFETARQFVEKNIATYNNQLSPDNYHNQTILDTNENEKFFEFKTIKNNPTSPDMQYYLRYRVFKCSYISALQYITPHFDGSSISDEYIGVFAQKPITKENAKELIEFLWYSPFNNSGSKVLSSFTQEDENSIQHTIFETKSSGIDWYMAEEVILIKSIYTINKDSGEIKLNQENIKTIQGSICH